jgi:RNA polymerase sigma-70 factor, ECF subfamily
MSIFARMDTAAFEQMYRQHYTRLRNTAWTMTGDKDAAHDLVQEVFVRLWHRHTELDHILNQPAYLLRAVMNASLTFLERRKRNAPAELDRTSGTSASDDNVIYKELEQKVNEALDKLPPRCKAIFLLSRFEERSYKEIAAIMGLSLKTVENQMGIALKKMRDELRTFISPEFLTALIASLLASLYL